ncbi:MAG: hypothetical protein K8T10_05420 [Candidatus Eremiobacteraeota bacterium]|nr:hypothetical protein [Candidatus Eremiobacteraeota bacterium]
MKIARRFLVLTILLTILLSLLFMMPKSYENLKLWLGFLCILVLTAFMLTLWSWRKKRNPNEKKEIEMSNILSNISRKNYNKNSISYHD